ncbi:putative cytochrome P450 [Helianthus annuus]|nr:putative cytochrome P450 [Helianthus annuus]
MQFRIRIAPHDRFRREAFLVNHPVVLKIAQQELENHDGRDRKVEESDMNNLVYLQAIIKETMRLYRAAPLSVPHESTEDCIVGEDTQRGDCGCIPWCSFGSCC